MYLEGIMLNEMSVRVRRMPTDFTYMKNLKKKPHKVNEETKQEQTHRCREQTGGCKMGEGLGSSMRKVKGFTSTNWQ